MRRDYGTDRAAVSCAVGVAADVAENRADIQARAATNAVQRITLLRVSEQFRAPIIKQNHALHEQAKQMAASIEIQDEWRSGLEDAITSIVTGRSVRLRPGPAEHADQGPPGVSGGTER